MNRINLFRNGTQPFPKFRRNTHLMEVTDPYLVGGMPLVDLVDLLNLTGEGLVH